METELRDPDAPVATEASEATVDFVLFDIGKETFALPTRDVERIAELRDVVAIPLAPPYVLGVTLLEGQLVAVVDLPSMLGNATSSGESRQLLVLRSANFVIGLVADHMHHLVSVPETQVRPALTQSDMADPLRRGFIPVDDRHIDLIDVAAIVSRVVGDERAEESATT